MSQPKFWAKTGRGELQDNGQPKYHPVICHLADTAAVAMEIVQCPGIFKSDRDRYKREVQ